MREIPVVQLGLGGVGRALIEQVIAAESRGVPARRWRAHPRWIAVADSRGLLSRPGADRTISWTVSWTIQTSLVSS